MDFVSAWADTVPMSTGRNNVMRHTGSPYLCAWCGFYDASGMTASGGHPICDACWDEGRDGFAPIYTMEGA